MQLQSENINELSEALSSFKLNMSPLKKNKKVKIPTKSGRNIDFGYCDLAEIFSTIDRPLSENGLSVSQPIFPMEGKLFVLTQISHKSGQWIRSYIPIEKSGDLKTFGADITYIKRYGLTSLLGLAADDDIDMSHEDDDRSKKEVEKQDIYIDSVQKKQIEDLIKTTSSDHLNLKKNLKIDDWGKLEKRYFKAIIQSLSHGIKDEIGNRTAYATVA